MTLQPDLDLAVRFLADYAQGGLIALTAILPTGGVVDQKLGDRRERWEPRRKRAALRNSRRCAGRAGYAVMSGDGVFGTCGAIRAPVDSSACRSPRPEIFEVRTVTTAVTWSWGGWLPNSRRWILRRPTSDASISSSHGGTTTRAQRPGTSS